jgi:hypothetical protein
MRNAYNKKAHQNTLLSSAPGLSGGVFKIHPSPEAHFVCVRACEVRCVLKEQSLWNSFISKQTPSQPALKEKGPPPWRIYLQKVHSQAPLTPNRPSPALMAALL